MFLTTERKVKASFTGDERRWQTNEDQTKNQISKRCTDPDDSAYDRTDESRLKTHNIPPLPASANPLPFSEEEWYQILSGMVTVMTALWIWLKNEKKEGKK